MAGEGEHILIELQREVRVISTKETSEPSALGHAPPLDMIYGEQGVFHEVAAAGRNTPDQAREKRYSRDSWLIEIDAEGQKTLDDHQIWRKPRIQRAPAFLRDARNNKSFFEPELVSLGPYHHGLDRLAAMEEHKKAAAVRYAERQGVTMGELYARVEGVTGEARQAYADAFAMDDDAFANMMFLDSCFILHFIACSVEHAESPSISPHLHGIITRDIFLLENQVPFVVLDALMCSTKRVNYDEFIASIAGEGWRWHPAVDYDVQEEPIHLLERLRTRLLGRFVPLLHVSMKVSWQRFRSVMELKEANIKFKKSESCCLRDVSFEHSRVQGHLHLPQIVVDDLTRPRFLNLIALEMCPDGRYDYGVTSYVCFLNDLIDHAEDVKELRRKEILLHTLGSDQQVADLFNELGSGLSPDKDAYWETMMSIEDHCENRWNVALAAIMHTHFELPCSTVTFLAAVFLLVLATLQTFFGIFPKFAVG